jgi:hypothetical protein
MPFARIGLRLNDNKEEKAKFFLPQPQRAS